MRAWQILRLRLRSLFHRDAAETDGTPCEADLALRELGLRVGRHDRAGDRLAGVGRELHPSDRARDPVDGQRHADDAGARDRHLVRRRAHERGRGFGHRDGIVLALLAGARVRVPAVDHDRAQRTAREMPARDDARRGDDLVRGEDPGGAARTVRRDHSDVVTLGNAVLHARGGDRAAEPACERDPFAPGQSGSASSPIVSG